MTERTEVSRAYKVRIEMPRRKSKLDEYVEILVAILIGGALLWGFVIQPLIIAVQSGVQSLSMWVQDNIMGITIAFLGILGLLIAVYVLNRRSRLQSEEEIRIQAEYDRAQRQAYEVQQEQLRIKAEQEGQAFEAGQRARGLDKFIDRFGNEKWGAPSELEEWKKVDEEARLKESLFYKVVEAIKEFRPSRRYRDEYGYHTELQGWMRSRFPDSEVELQTGASRPDIVIGDIAIEVKGPTDNQALNTLTTKCLKYSQYYRNLIFVLFEESFSERNFNEIIQGVRRYFPHVEVIRQSQLKELKAPFKKESVKFCIECGEKLELNARFCINCGTLQPEAI